MKYNLKSRNYNNENEEVALCNLLIERGIKQPADWLHPSSKNEISPFRLGNMKNAIELLHNQLKANQESNILVVVDSDLDGYTSGAMVYMFLKQIATKANISFVLHPGKEHGIVLDDIEEDTDLIIVPDAGSSQAREQQAILESKQKLIILDHHEVGERIFTNMDLSLLNNLVLVNNQVGDYPNKALSGAGIVLKFIQAYCAEYGTQMQQKLYALAACGIVADVMDISDLENKQIISYGLKYIKEHLFLQGLINKSHYNIENPEATIKDVGWVLGPHINAIIRLGTQEQKNIVFKALVSPGEMIPTSKRGSDDSVPVFEEAIRLCENAKKRQSTAVEKSIKTILEETEIDDDTPYVLFIDEEKDLTFELSGLIANNLLSKYNRPVFLLREYTDKKINQYRGSVRGKPVEGLENLKETVSKVSGVEMAEGHAFAFGIGIEKDMIVEFKAHLASLLQKVNFNVSLYSIDLISHYNKLNKSIAELMSREDIWGHGVEKPLGLIESIPSSSYELMGADQQHIKINCGNYDVLFFKEKELADSLVSGEKYNIDAIGEFTIDQSYNVGRLQFIVKDYELKDFTEKTVYDLVF